MIMAGGSYVCTIINAKVPFSTTGGMLFISAYMMTDDGQFYGATKGGDNIYYTLQVLWKQLYEEGEITKVKGGKLSTVSLGV